MKPLSVINNGIAETAGMNLQSLCPETRVYLAATPYLILIYSISPFFTSSISYYSILFFIIFLIFHNAGVYAIYC